MAVETREALIRVVDLVKGYGSRQVLDGVSIEVYRGETLVIMGGSGCGKSTFLRHLIGTLKPDRGEIWMFGKQLGQATEEELEGIRRRFGMLFQSGALFDSLTVGENVALPLREHTKLDKEIIRIIVKMKLELVGMRGSEHLMPSQLSGGMRKRAGLARAIAMDPDIVFYDEPTAGLDPIMTAVIDRLTMDLAKKLRITSVVVTHDMTSAFRIADRMVMLHEGRVLEVGSPAEIRASSNPVVRQFISGELEGVLPLAEENEIYWRQLTA